MCLFAAQFNYIAVDEIFLLLAWIRQKTADFSFPRYSKRSRLYILVKPFTGWMGYPLNLNGSVK